LHEHNNTFKNGSIFIKQLIGEGVLFTAENKLIEPDAGNAAEGKKVL